MRALIPALFLLACLLLIVPGCSTPTETKKVSAPTETATTIELDQLTQHWVHSYEEDGDPADGMVFRPRDSREFAPSWFRMAYVFHEGGDLEWMYLAPNDGHHLKPGSWRLDTNAAPILRLEMDGPRSLEILELTENLLRLRMPPTR